MGIRSDLWTEKFIEFIEEDQRVKGEKNKCFF